MRLEIQNINKIKDADIALNGLTVIVGENDMGKSTIGRAFFSIIKAVSNMRSLSNESSVNKASKHIDSLYKHFYGKNIIDVLWICCLVSNRKWKEYVRTKRNEMLFLII